MKKHFSYKNKSQVKKYLEVLQQFSDSKKIFYNQTRFEIENKIVLELGTRNGDDLMYYKKYAKEVHSVEPDENMYSIAQKVVQDDKLIIADFHTLPYKDNTFDVVVSRYTIPSSPHLVEIYKEVSRVLKPGGAFIFLANHPFRQYYEQQTFPKDYFKKQVVHPKLFEGLIVLNEYMYTLSEYFSDYFFSQFQLEYYTENNDSDDLESEQMNGDTYPCFFFVKARKL